MLAYEYYNSNEFKGIEIEYTLYFNSRNLYILYFLYYIIFLLIILYLFINIYKQNRGFL